MTVANINQSPIKSLDFNLPDQLQCGLPTEVRGIARDEVRLMISHRSTDLVQHTQFKFLDHYLKAGDVLVVNTSGTLKAAVEAIWQRELELKVHFSTKISANRWVVELREWKAEGAKRFHQAKVGQVLQLKTGGQIHLIKPYYSKGIFYQNQNHLQLWEVDMEIEGSVEDYLDQFGAPIRYSYLKEQYPQSYYQTVFAREMGSTEMPSAGRAFTPELVTRLVAKGVQFAPILLHTGVASLEVDERPYEEYFKVSESTASTVNLALRQGRRVIAVGTTAVRALESTVDPKGIVRAKEGWTDLYITPERGIYSVSGMLTGMHEPKASHLRMLEALAGRQHLTIAYQEAVTEQYQWHEFGDLHLIL